MLSSMTQTNPKTGEKNQSFWVADIKNIITMRPYTV